MKIDKKLKPPPIVNSILNLAGGFFVTHFNRQTYTQLNHMLHHFFNVWGESFEEIFETTTQIGMLRTPELASMHALKRPKIALAASLFLWILFWHKFWKAPKL